MWRLERVGQGHSRAACSCCTRGRALTVLEKRENKLQDRTLRSGDVDSGLVISRMVSLSLGP